MNSSLSSVDNQQIIINNPDNFLEVVSMNERLSKNHIYREVTVNVRKIYDFGKCAHDEAISATMLKIKILCLLSEKDIIDIIKRFKGVETIELFLQRGIKDFLTLLAFVDECPYLRYLEIRGDITFQIDTDKFGNFDNEKNLGVLKLHHFAGEITIQNDINKKII